MNGSNGHGPKNPLEAMLAAQQQRGMQPPAQQQIDPVQFFAQFFGLNVPTMRALMPSVAPCLCGKCQGVGVQLEVRLHFPILGPPEFITRGDAPKPAPGPTPATTTEKPE